MLWVIVYREQQEEAHISLCSLHNMTQWLSDTKQINLTVSQEIHTHSLSLSNSVYTGKCEDEFSWLYCDQVIAVRLASILQWTSGACVVVAVCRVRCRLNISSWLDHPVYSQITPEQIYFLWSWIFLLNLNLVSQVELPPIENTMKVLTSNVEFLINVSCATSEPGFVS